MPKKKIVKKAKAVKKTKLNKSIKAQEAMLKAKGGSTYEDIIKPVLSQILLVFEAALLDAFRQYVESKMRASQVASVPEFMAGFKYTVAAHSISEEKLLGSLDEYELEYVKNADKKPAPKAPVVKVVPVPQAPAAEPSTLEPQKVAEPDKKNTSVFDSLDLI